MPSDDSQACVLTIVCKIHGSVILVCRCVREMMRSGGLPGYWRAAWRMHVYMHNGLLLQDETGMSRIVQGQLCAQHRRARNCQVLKFVHLCICALMRLHIC